MDATTPGRATVSGVRNGDRAATLASSFATRSNSMTACDLPRAVASPRAVSSSSSFNLVTIALPTVSLPFLKDYPASHADEWRQGGTTDHQPAPHRRTPPRSPASQAAIDKCLAAIAECKAALKQSTEDGACHDDTLPHELRTALQPPRGSAALLEDIMRGSAAPLGVKNSSEEMHRWLDDMPGDCAPSTHRTPAFKDDASSTVSAQLALSVKSDTPKPAPTSASAALSRSSAVPVHAAPSPSRGGASLKMQQTAPTLSSPGGASGTPALMQQSDSWSGGCGQAVAHPQAQQAEPPRVSSGHDTGHEETTKSAHVRVTKPLLDASWENAAWEEQAGKQRDFRKPVPTPPPWSRVEGKS